MKLKRKFMMLALLMGVAIVIVCAVSYHFASDELEETTNRELSVTVAREAAQLNGWLETKKAFGESTSNVLTSYVFAQDAKSFGHDYFRQRNFGYGVRAGR